MAQQAGRLEKRRRPAPVCAGLETGLCQRPVETGGPGTSNPGAPILRPLEASPTVASGTLHLDDTNRHRNQPKYVTRLDRFTQQHRAKKQTENWSKKIEGRNAARGSMRQ